MDRRRAPNGIGHLMILLLYQSNHGYGKSFSTELSFFTKSLLDTHNEITCLMTKIDIFYRLYVKLQHFKIYLHAF